MDKQRNASVMLFTKISFFFLLLIVSHSANSQGFQQGDIIINGNLGGPQITPFVLRTGLNAYYKLKADKGKNEQFTFNISNSGVYNGKTEYGISENVGVGLAASYWDMTIRMANNYRDNDPVSNIQTNFIDNYTFKVSALALGLRGNYHFGEDIKSKRIDPYMGITLGVTRYTYNIGFESNMQGKTLPVNVYKWRSGWGSYFSSTFGVRYYPVSFIGLNAEIGWDRGAFLFGGIVFKIHSKPPKFLRDKDEKGKEENK
jgi:hypothetical protein